MIPGILLVTSLQTECNPLTIALQVQPFNHPFTHPVVYSSILQCSSLSLSHHKLLPFPLFFVRISTALFSSSATAQLDSALLGGTQACHQSISCSAIPRIMHPEKRSFSLLMVHASEEGEDILLGSPRMIFTHMPFCNYHLLKQPTKEAKT